MKRIIADENFDKNSSEEDKEDDEEDESHDSSWEDFVVFCEIGHDSIIVDGEGVYKDRDLDDNDVRKLINYIESSQIVIRKLVIKRENCIGDEGLVYIANMLRTNSTIEKLSVGITNNNKNLSVGLTSLTEALKVSTRLKSLDLDFWCIGMPSDIKVFSEAIMLNSNLTKLSLSYIECSDDALYKNLFNLLKANNSLKKLILQYNPINEENFMLLTEALEHNTVLDALGFSDNLEGDDYNNDYEFEKTNALEILLVKSARYLITLCTDATNVYEELSKAIPPNSNLCYIYSENRHPYETSICAKVKNAVSIANIWKGFKTTTEPLTIAQLQEAAKTYFLNQKAVTHKDFINQNAIDAYEAFKHATLELEAILCLSGIEQVTNTDKSVQECFYFPNEIIAILGEYVTLIETDMAYGNLIGANEIPEIAHGSLVE